MQSKLPYHEARIIDAVAGLELSKDQVTEQYWPLQTIDCIWHGMKLLAEKIATIERAGTFRATPFGPLLSDLGEPRSSGGFSVPEIVCFFHWYAVSACSYVRLVGRLASSAGLTKDSPSKYVQEVIPAVKLWRDKVAAHLAFADPRGDDQGAMEELCVAPHLQSTGNRIVVAGIQMTIETASGDRTSAEFLEWSVTETHEKLRQRYYP